MGGILTGLDLIRSERGLAARVADACGLHRSTVSQWRHEIPEQHVSTIARVTGFPACRLRPDLFPAKVHFNKRSAGAKAKGKGTRAKRGRYGQ